MNEVKPHGHCARCQTDHPPDGSGVWLKIGEFPNGGQIWFFCPGWVA